MTSLINGKNIVHTKGDTLILTFSADEQFEAGANCKFVIAKDELTDIITVDKSNLSGNDTDIVISAAETSKLTVGAYIWKLVYTAANGDIITIVSGDFKSVWGDGK